MAESSHFDGAFEMGRLVAGPDEYSFERPVSWEVEVTNTGSALLVMGTADAVGSCACARCLEEVVVDFHGDIEGYFLVNGADAGGFDDSEDAPGEDEFDVLPADHIIDLEPLICAALVMDAPQQPLCRDDCAGLCPQCGANLNEGPCGCGDDPELAAFEQVSNPFSKLVDLF